MKTIFAKLRASLDLDRSGPPPKRRETAVDSRFEESLGAMDRELREFRAHPVVPTGLHPAVMRAVQKASRESEPASVALLWRRLALIALVGAVGAGVFWGVNQPARDGADRLPASEAPPSFAAAFDRGHELTQAAPAAVLRPLAGEMELLNRDFQKAMSLLAANMP